jgi:hypothetical protein
MGMLGYVDLSEDARAAGQLLGKGVRQGFGLENKEEALQRISSNANWETTEGRATALKEIQSVDYDTWWKIRKEFSDYDIKQAKLHAPALATYNEAGNLMYQQFNTTPMLTSFITNLYGETLFKGKDSDEIREIKGGKGFMTQIRKKIEDSTKSFSRFIENNPKYRTKATLNALLDNQTELFTEFKAFQDSRGNQEMSALANELITTDPNKRMTSIISSDGGPPPPLSVGIDKYMEDKYPTESAYQLRGRKNSFTVAIDNIGVLLNPDTSVEYFVEGARPGGIDATIGNLADIFASSINEVTSTWGDITNYFSSDGVEADKKRAEFKEASEWFISSAGGHRYFSINPEKLAELKTPEAALKFYKGLSTDDKGSEAGVMDAISLNF